MSDSAGAGAKDATKPDSRNKLTAYMGVPTTDWVNCIADRAYEF